MERRRVPEGPRRDGRRAADHVDLTPRQREILDLVAAGLENKEIAGRLGVSEQAVKQQVSVLLRKFAVSSRAVLTRTAVTMRLLGSRGVLDAPLEYLFDRAPLGVAITKGPDHRFVAVNRAFVDMYGDRDYAGRTPRECFPEQEEALVVFDRAYSTGVGGGGSEAAHAVRMPDGSERRYYVSWTLEPVRDASGGVVGLIVFASDVTSEVARRRGLESLTDDQRRLLEQLPFGIVYLGTDGHIHFANGAARRLLGGEIDPAKTPRELVEDWQVRYADGRLIEDETAPHTRALAGWPYDGEIVARRTDGTNVTLRVSVRPLHDDSGSVTGAVVAAWERDGPVAPAMPSV